MVAEEDRHRLLGMDDERKEALREWMMAEHALVEGTRAFFESGLELTEERKQEVKALFAERDRTREAYRAHRDT